MTVIKAALLAILLLFQNAALCKEQPQHVFLTVNEATIKGQTFAIPDSDVSYHAFQSLPYAEPPIRELRFKPPVPRGLPKSGNFDATRDLPACPQYEQHALKFSSTNVARYTFRNQEGRSKDPVEGKEDCLYLNVYVPEKIYNARGSGAGAPVMVWIHGGAFIGGSGSKAFYAPDNFMETESVVMVSINYRLGALGFLNLQDDNTVAGNMGMKDQVAALKWVQENIGHFGGDASRVTIFGESAGGITVMDLVQSPHANGLFSAAIAQSGPGMLMPFMREFKKSGEYGKAFLDFIGCKKTNDAMQCLIDAPLYKIMEGTRMFEKYTFTPGIFIPVVDAAYARDPFLPDNRNTNLKQGKFNKVPLMMGGLLDEGALFMMQFMMNETNFDVVSGDVMHQIPILFFGVDGNQTPPATVVKSWELLRNYEARTEEEQGDPELKLAGNFCKNNYRSVRDAFTDFTFLAPIDMTARAAAKASEEPVFYYNYRHKGQLSLVDLYGYDKSKGDLGVCHADDLFIQFTPLSKVTNEEDAKMAKKMVELWTGFATAKDHKAWGRNVGWAPVEKDEKRYGKFHILDTGDLRMPDAESDAEEKRRRERLVFAGNMLEGEVTPKPIKKRTIDINMNKTPPHGGEL